MQIAIKLNAPNDRNGNPRRCWVVTDDVQPVDVLDAGYEGPQALWRAYPDATCTMEVNVSASEYRDWIRFGREIEKARRATAQ